MKIVHILTPARPRRLAVILTLSLLTLAAWHTAPSAFADEPFPAGSMAYIVLNDTELYAQPDFGATVVTRLGHGSMVTVAGEPRTLDSGVTWYQVTTNVGAGWLTVDDLSHDANAPAPPATATPAPPPPTPVPPTPVRSGDSRGTSQAPAAVVDTAMNYNGYRYRWGGTTPAGFDCSGFVFYVFNHVGLQIPRAMVDQIAGGTRIAAAELRAGDLVYFKNTSKRGISHIAIYIGNGKIVHAVNERVGVTVSELWSPYWAAHYAGSVRVIP